MKMILKYHDRSLLIYVNKFLKANYKLRQDINKIDYNCSESDLSWLKNIFICPPNNNELKNIITEHFSHIELYHTCLPKKLKPYYENGIEILNTERIEQEFISLVKSKISEYRNRDQDIKEAINKTNDFNEEIRQKSSGDNVCLHIDKRHALTQPGFCFYGGEYMCYIIRYYPNKQIKQRLIDICKTIGIPTLFTVRLPLDNQIMNTDSFESYIMKLLVYWASRYIYKQHLNDICSTTYNLHYKVDPKFISRHEHPRKFCNNISEVYCDKCKKKIIRKK